MQKSLLTLLGISSGVFAAQNANCDPEPPVTCYPDDCKTCYCLGPENMLVNAPVRPITCNGDWMITVAGFYWSAAQDGMEYAIDNQASFGGQGLVPPTNLPAVLTINNITNAEYLSPDCTWDFGFKLGLGYNTTCDGWDFGILWTWYRNTSHTHDEAEFDDNHALMPIWSDFNDVFGTALFATDIETDWRLKLNLVDIELGREYWVSQLVTLRPFIGLRIATIDQKFDIEHKGGSWSAANTLDPADNPRLTNDATFENDFKGIGPRAGLNSIFHLGCGWGIYGDLAASIVYGRFEIDEREDNHEAIPPFHKTRIMDVGSDFRKSSPMLDLALGIQWGGLFCECQYGITVNLGWEQHIFFHQNQFWRNNQMALAGDFQTDADPNPNSHNSYHQRRGDLTTQGVTLTVVFEF